jgi:hypothetical protein
MANVTVVVPRSSWTFKKLDEETDYQAINRFIFTIMTNEKIRKQYLASTLLDSFNVKAENVITTGWMNTTQRFVEDGEIERLIE